MLHHVGDPVFQRRHFFPGHAERTRSPHAYAVALGAPGLIFVRTTVDEGGLVPTSSAGSTCSGHPSHLAIGMLSGAVCGLVLLLGCLAEALAMDVFLPLTLLVLVAISLCF